jgi:hypothetical protein
MGNSITVKDDPIKTVSDNITNINTVASDLTEGTSEIDTVATNITNVNNVGNNISNVNSVHSNATNINSAVSNATNINTVAGSISNVNTVASNVSGINDFADRYRVASSAPSSNNDAGDLFFNTNLGKLLVYNSSTSAWEETQTIGSFFINTISSFSGTGGNSATFNNSAYKFTLSNAGQFAQQMLVSINGVVQKPNSGTGQPSEGFALDGSEIVFAAPPPTGADYFIVTIGATVSIGTPSAGTVTPASFANGTSSNDGKFLRANNNAAPSFETIDLTNLNASNLTSGTIPAARFPSALPSIDGSALTGIQSGAAGNSENVFHENENSMDNDYTIGNGASNINAGVFGPLTLNATLNIPATSVLTIV